MNYSVQRNKMVENQIIRRGVQNEYVLDAMRKVPRHEFVRSIDESYSYGDYPLSIGHGQTISQPYIVALMIELLEPQPTDKVMEIGSGCGYAAAVLSKIVKHVYAIELIKDLAEMAKTNLTKLNYENITVINKDGKEGYKKEAPYDKILISAATKKVPEYLLDQLAINGRLVVPLGNGFSQILTIITKTGKESYQEQRILGVRFVPLV